MSCCRFDFVRAGLLLNGRVLFDLQTLATTECLIHVAQMLRVLTASNQLLIFAEDITRARYNAKVHKQNE